jgi:predicted negative regulator of RcsB-dependent stress response
MEIPKQSRISSVKDWLGWFIGLNLIWVLLVVIAVWLGWRSYILTTSGEVTQARVVRLIEEERNQFTTDIKPVFQFQVDGEVYEVYSQNSYRWWNRYFRFSEGKEIEIRYDPSNPELAEINSFLDVWSETIILVIFSTLFAIGVNGYFLMKWRMSKS